MYLKRLLVPFWLFCPQYFYLCWKVEVETCNYIVLWESRLSVGHVVVMPWTVPTRPAGAVLGLQPLDSGGMFHLCMVPLVGVPLVDGSTYGWCTCGSFHLWIVSILSNGYVKTSSHTITFIGVITRTWFLDCQHMALSVVVWPCLLARWVRSLDHAYGASGAVVWPCPWPSGCSPWTMPMGPQEQSYDHASWPGGCGCSSLILKTLSFLIDIWNVIVPCCYLKHDLGWWSSDLLV